MAAKVETPHHGDALLRFVKKHGHGAGKNPRSPEERELRREIAEESRAVYRVVELERLGLKEQRILERLDRDQAELAEVRTRIAELREDRS
jgi:hypothetical protein